MQPSATGGTRQLTTAAIVSLAAVLAALLLAPGARASNTPPSADSRLVGTWTNVNASSHDIKQIVIASTAGGGISVDMFGSCGGSLCEIGRVPAVIYGTGSTASTGKSFKVDVDAGFAHEIAFGTLMTGGGSLRLSLRHYADFTDATTRSNDLVKDTFEPAPAASTSVDATAASDYPAGHEPAPDSNLIGTWKNINTTKPTVTELIVSTDSSGNLLVHEFTRCSPSPCDDGTVSAVAFGNTVKATVGRSFIAPFDFGFKLQPLAADYIPSSGRLLVAEYNEFTDGSGRSNYAKKEQFEK